MFSNFTKKVSLKNPSVRNILSDSVVRPVSGCIQTEASDGNHSFSKNNDNVDD